MAQEYRDFVVSYPTGDGVTKSNMSMISTWAITELWLYKQFNNIYFSSMFDSFKMSFVKVYH